MFLARLELENFRGLRHAELEFGETTVLIGENDVGLTSLLQALALVLTPAVEPGAFAIEPHHFHRPDPRLELGPAPRLRVLVEYRERAPGEWGQLPAGELSRLLAEHTQPETRTLQVELHAHWDPERTSARSHWQLALGGRRLTGDDAELLEELRALSPLKWLRGGVVVAGAPTLEENGPNQLANDELSGLMAQVERHYLAVVEGTSPNLARTIEAGYRAARDLLAHARPGLARRSERFGSIVEEIVGPPSEPWKPARQAHRRAHGGAAQQVALLLLTGALLRSGGMGLEPGVEPVVVVEDPESHLHPMTLASVWELVTRIRWQKLVATHSGTLLASAPLGVVRRLARRRGRLHALSVAEGQLSPDELRRFSYHVRLRHDVASFARCWLLVEGETEFWMLPELARLCGYDLGAEGVACVEFAQCGVTPLLKVAEQLCIEWHLLADGDRAGREYVEAAEPFLAGQPHRRRLTLLDELDVEQTLYRHGYAAVFQREARVSAHEARRFDPASVIARASERSTKPALALEVLEAVAAPGSPGVPAALRHAIETAVALARETPLLRRRDEATRDKE